MKKDILNEIFETLSGVGVVSTEGEFSQDWLGHCESYLRTLRFKNAEPSLGTIAICASRLQNAAEQLRTLPRYQPLAKQLTSMSIKCRSLVDADSVEFDLSN